MSEKSRGPIIGITEKLMPWNVDGGKGWTVARIVALLGTDITLLAVGGGESFLCAGALLVFTAFTLMKQMAYLSGAGSDE